MLRGDYGLYRITVNSVDGVWCREPLVAYPNDMRARGVEVTFNDDGPVDMRDASVVLAWGHDQKKDLQGAEPFEMKDGSQSTLQVYFPGPMQTVPGTVTASIMVTQGGEHVFEIALPTIIVPDRAVIDPSALPSTDTFAMFSEGLATLQSGIADITQYTDAAKDAADNANSAADLANGAVSSVAGVVDDAKQAVKDAKAAVDDANDAAGKATKAASDATSSKEAADAAEALRAKAEEEREKKEAERQSSEADRDAKFSEAQDARAREFTEAQGKRDADFTEAEGKRDQQVADAVTKAEGAADAANAAAQAANASAAKADASSEKADASASKADTAAGNADAKAALADGAASAANAAASAASDANDAVAEAEKLRVAAEDARETSEAKRVEQELARETAQAKNNADQEANNKAAQGRLTRILKEGEFDPVTRIPTIEGDITHVFCVPTVEAEAAIAEAREAEAALKLAADGAGETPSFDGDVHPAVKSAQERLAAAYAEQATNHYMEWLWLLDDGGDGYWEPYGTSQAILPDAVTTDEIDRMFAGQTVSSEHIGDAAGLSYLVTKTKAEITAQASTQSTTDAAQDASIEEAKGAADAAQAAADAAKQAAKDAETNAASALSKAVEAQGTKDDEQDRAIEAANTAISTAEADLKAWVEDEAKAHAAETADKLGTKTVGSEKQPIYLKDGVPTPGGAEIDLVTKAADGIVPKLPEDATEEKGYALGWSTDGKAIWVTVPDLSPYATKAYCDEKIETAIGTAMEASY